MKMPDRVPQFLLAPCGVNCLVCYKYLQSKGTCPGCLSAQPDRPKHCKNCMIKKCSIDKGFTHCFECPLFPCSRIKRLEKIYTTKYDTSLIGNSIHAKNKGIEQLMIRERARWRCNNCQGILCLHDKKCSECHKDLVIDGNEENTV